MKLKIKEAIELKIKEAIEPVPEKIKTFTLEKGYKDSLVILDEEGWSVVGLRVVGGKVSVIHYRSLGDSDYNLNSSGQIQEVAE
jgi:hypothetical protein